MIEFNVDEFKSHFPLFNFEENKNLVYLDNAATSQKPKVVMDAISEFYCKTNANANRSGHRLARAATAMINCVRHQVAQFINASGHKEIVFTSGATEGVNVIAKGLSQNLEENDEIVISLSEHHANIVPWQELAKETKSVLQYIPQSLVEWESFCNDKTKIIAITAASNTLGSITDLSYVKKIKERYPKIIIVIDASQWVSHKVIDVQSIKCDFLVFSAHKMYGPFGLGVLFGRESRLNSLTPSKFGGEMINTVKKYSSSYVSGPERFEGGTSPLAAIAGLGASIEFLSCYDRFKIERYENFILAYLFDKLEGLKLRALNFESLRPGQVIFEILSNKENNIGIVSISSLFFSMNDLSVWLDEMNIAVRVGDHCAQPLFKSLDVRSVLRISLAAYNTVGDIDKLVLAMEEFLKLNTSLSNNKNSNKNSIDITEYKKINNWKDRYKKIIEWGREYTPSMDIREEKNKISGCESSVWLVIKQENGVYTFVHDSDSAIIKGLALMVTEKIVGKTGQEVKDFDFASYLQSLNLDRHLSESRVSGLNRIISTIIERVH